MYLSIFLPTLAVLSLSTAQSTNSTTCYWANGSAADPSDLQPCATSAGNDGFFACCPPSTAKNLYPLDYPICTENGLCKAGNSDFLARGGCTDNSFSSTSCPQYCPSKTDSGMAGLTNCDGDTPWWCCNTAHDDGACNCSPPNGTAFQLDGTAGIKWSDVVQGGSGSNSSMAGSESTSASQVVASMASTTMSSASEAVVPAGSSTSPTAGQMSSTSAGAAASSVTGPMSTIYQTVPPTPSQTVKNGAAMRENLSGMSLWVIAVAVVLFG